MRDSCELIIIFTVWSVLPGTAGAVGPPSGPPKRSPRDAVVAGAGGIDEYEASAWRVPGATTANRGLVARIRAGSVGVAELVARGATPLGPQTHDYAPCADNGGLPSGTSRAGFALNGIGFRCAR
jgi:hypothetical protein